MGRDLDQPGAPGRNTGHGHVYPRPDGSRARCGGPHLCKLCALDAARKATEHDYLSTACHHQQHDRCRRVCKFCDTPCRCRCHEADR